MRFDDDVCLLFVQVRHAQFDFNSIGQVTSLDSETINSPQICCSTWTLYLDLNPNAASLFEKQQVIILQFCYLIFPFMGIKPHDLTQLKESNVLTIAPLRELKLQS